MRRFELKKKTKEHELPRSTIKLTINDRIISDNNNRQLKNPKIDGYTNWPRQ